jgi:hypothetical protein
MTAHPIPFPNRPRAPSSLRADVTCPGAPPPAPGQGLSEGEVIAAAARFASEQHAFETYQGALAARRARLAHLAESVPFYPEPDIPVAWWAPLFWLGAFMVGAALSTAVICAILYLTQNL